MIHIDKSGRCVNEATVQAVSEAALEAHTSGLCIIPPAEDGSKRPLPDRSGKWDHFKQQRPTLETIHDWYPGRSGLGVVTGAVSGHCECWDFDDKAAYERFVDGARETGLGEIVARIEAGYRDATPGDGVRWLVRYPVEVERKPGSGIKLARRRKEEHEKQHPEDNIKTLIEMPAFAITAPSNGRVHPSGRAYVRLNGSFPTIASYSAEERLALMDLARSYDETPRSPAAISSISTASGGRPGDDFTAKTTWAEILSGWTRVRTRKDGVTEWRRPGKAFGISATTNFGGSDLLYVFSSSTGFEPEKAHDRFAAYAVLNHGGDFTAASRELARQGYGERNARRKSSTQMNGAGSNESSPDQREYAEKDGCIVWHRETKDGGVQTTKLTNFTARIVADITLDDDVEVFKLFEIEARLFGRLQRFTIPAHQFPSLNWVTEKLGARAIVQPGQMIAKRTAVAIQVLSGEIPESKVLAHTGWRRIGDDFVFLHAGGALGPQGPRAEIRVSLPRELSLYRLPDVDNATLKVDVQTSLGLRRLAPARVIMPGLAAVYRAVIGGSDLSLHYSGLTGVFKSELLALLLQHFGPGMDSRHLPAAWSATENRLELLASLAKDVILAIDDFVLPANATAQDRARLMAKADRVLRAQGNNSARGRLRADLTMRPDRPPRGLIASSGEETPAGASLRARMAVVEVRTDEINEEELTVAQAHAAGGVYARALAGFVCWLAPRLENVQAEFKILRQQRRQQFESNHKRSSDVFAQLSATWTITLRFAVDIGAVTDVERAAIETEVLNAIHELLAEQEELQASADPIARFRDLIKAALVAGKAHVANAKLGGHCKPDDWQRWGWRPRAVGAEITWHPQGDCLGWVDAEGLYLDPDVSFDAARKMGGGDFSITAETLLRRMADRKLLLTIDMRGGRRRLKARKTIGGDRRYVIHVSHSITGPLVRKSGPSGPDGPGCEKPLEDEEVTR